MSSSMLLQVCDACRASDSQCDLQRPRCGRCTANSGACIRREAPVDFAFVNQNEVAASASRRAAHRRSRPSSRRINIPLDVSILERGTQPPARRDSFPQFSASILQTQDDRAIRRFVSRWAARQTSLGCLESMPELLEASGDDSALQKAILATAYADLAVFERHGDQIANSYRAYSGSLRRIRDELSNPNFVASDGVLAAILAIDAFEILYTGRVDPLGAHTQAIIRFLELRKDVPVADKQSFVLWRSAHQRTYVRQLFFQLPTFSSFAASNAPLEDEHQPEAQTIKFVARACDIMSKLECERNSPVQQVNVVKIVRLCNELRSIMQEAYEISENSIAVPRPRWAALNLQSDPELKRVFPQATAVVFDDFWMARDRVLFSICNIKILDMLIDVRTEVFSSHHAESGDIEVAREFLLDSQPDLAALQSHCRFVLDVVPLLIGLIDKNGIAKVDPWTLNDTGVLSVKSPTTAIGRLKYAQASIRQEANGIVSFLKDHRHILPEA